MGVCLNFWNSSLPPHTRRPEDAGEVLADQLIPLMEELWVPNGLKALGFTPDDIPDLVQGTLPQHRVLKLAPRHVGEAELTTLFEKTMTIY